MIGQRFGRLVVLHLDHQKSVTEKRSWWRCVCDCGNHKSISQKKLKTGHTKSCGCLLIEWTRSMGQSRRTHGEAINETPEYKTWSGMLQRCENPNAHHYARYGGRGIRVCRRWHRYENFISDVGRKPSSRHSLDRIDPNGNYEPRNTRWATPKQQARNRTDNRRIQFNGENLTLAEWAERLNTSLQTIRQRLVKGWSVQRTLTTPVHRSRTLTVEGVTKTVREWADQIGLTDKALYQRLKQGWSPERAVRTPRTPWKPLRRAPR